LRGNREVAGRGIRGSTKYYGNTHASSDVEGARGIRGDTGRESAERNLDASRKSVDGRDGNTDCRADRTLLEGDGTR
jgi:hypothetical protein